MQVDTRLFLNVTVLKHSNAASYCFFKWRSCCFSVYLLRRQHFLINTFDIAVLSGWTQSFVYGDCFDAVLATHPIIVREQRQRQTTSSMWITITSVVVGGTDWTTGQHQSTGLQWTNTAGHTWTGQWRLQSSSCPVWIHSRQDQQEQRLHLFNQRSTKTQTCLFIKRKFGRNRAIVAKHNKLSFGISR